jgi:phage host-nuclease inhibitor protein Gam
MAHNAFAFIFLAIPLTAIVAGMFKRYLQFKVRQLELMGDQTAERAAQYAAKTERLEQRVAVLERILTDRSTTLGDEIERLRDKPIN